MKIAWLIQCHKNPDQINRLIKILSSDGDDIYIHIDIKNYDIEKQIIRLSNVFILKKENCVSVCWGDYSQCDATLQLLNAAHCNSISYDYYFLLSGQCFLIKSIRELKEKLEREKCEYIDVFSSVSFDKRNDLKYPMILKHNNLISKLLRSFYFIITGGRNKTFEWFKRRPILKNYYGSAWWGLSRNCIEKILKLIEINNSIVDYFRYSLCPDESMFQTLVMSVNSNNKLAGSLWYIDWSTQKNNPKVLTENDYNNIKGSNKYFARKFDSTINPRIIDMLEGDV